jgi:diguanylate cyclase (GGDEF)-like protein
MHLDPPTVSTIIVLQALLNGGLLTIGWIQDRSSRALAFWAVAHLTAALGSALMTAGFVQASPALMSSGLISMGAHYALNLHGVQLFEGRAWPGFLPAWPVAIVAGAMLITNGDERAMNWALMIVAASACSITAFEIWRCETGALRWSLSAILLVHGASNLTWGGDPMRGHSEFWFMMFSVDIMCYGAGTALLCIAMSQHRAERGLRKAAYIDELTGLLNRRAFVSSATSQLQALRRHRQPAAMLMFDLDGFKGINDRHGHLAGDHVLRRFSCVLRGRLRGDTTIGRLGGEEFAALLPGVIAGDAIVVAERTRAALADEMIVFAGARIVATVSVGICAEAVAGHELDTMLGAADRALYQAKTRGRNRVEQTIMVETAAQETLYPGSPRMSADADEKLTLTA